MKKIPWSKPQLNIQDKKFLNNAFNSTWISDGDAPYGLGGLDALTPISLETLLS